MFIRIKAKWLRQRGIINRLQRFIIILRTAGGVGLRHDVRIDRPALLGNLGQVACLVRGNQHGRTRLSHAHVDVWRPVAVTRAEPFA